MGKFIVDPEKEFLVVRHSFLNGNSYDPVQVVEETQELGSHVNGKQPITCLEGDLLQIKETGELIFTHQNFSSVTQATFNKLREDGLASTLEEVLDKVTTFTSDQSERLALCLELKFPTTRQTMDKAVKVLRLYDISDVYFDSFFPGKLHYLQQMHVPRKSSSFSTSLHLGGNIGVVPFRIPGKQNSDVVTVPYPTSLWFPSEKPVIYGAVGSVDALERVSDHESVYGAYVRLKEGSGLGGVTKMFYHSLTNTKQTRNDILSNCSNT